MAPYDFPNRQLNISLMSHSTPSPSKPPLDGVQFVRELLDGDTFAYLQKKHLGGRSGAKGGRYEDIFAAVQIAESARLKGAAAEEVTIESQVPLCFIDDLLMIDVELAKRTYFQLKNTATLTWNAGTHSLKKDCALQGHLCQARNESESKCVIVTSDRETARQLADTMPAEIRAFTRVQWFPWEPAPTILCQRWPSELSALSWLSKHETPSFHDVAEVLSVLQAAWIMKSGDNGAVTALDVIKAARSFSPTLIRPLISDEEAKRALQDNFKATLARVENFSYSVVKGFFTWQYLHPNGSVSSGVLSHDCLSEHFRAFQSRLVKLAPLTFDSMEDQLL